MKKCRFCAEEIQDDAIKCRFCGEFLEQSRKSQTKWYFARSVVIIGLLSLGPLALPLVWFNPRYKIIAKLGVTSLVIGLSIWLYYLSIGMYQNLMSQIRALGVY